MEELWYIEISRGVEGPFTKQQLKEDSRLNPDTFVWREGFDQWKKIKEVPELDDLFEEEVVVQDDTEDESVNEYLDDEIALERGYEPPPPYLYWILIGLLIAAYFTYTYLFGKQG